ncbi:hypothetical protein NDU88_008331 [Pleurodeles waltl]|uniref:Uncharacterized protein n=1 Tax=Pleurodeles waltl TaxID=8319 RepID=A0AAV7NVR4_PLEWA|nr:hypothetical protein NDU88_008331 [Pleurodeles waltl]
MGRAEGQANTRVAPASASTHDPPLDAADGRRAEYKYAPVTGHQPLFRDSRRHPGSRLPGEYPSGTTESKAPENPEERDICKKEETHRGKVIDRRSGEEVGREVNGDGRQNEKTCGETERQEEVHSEDASRPVHRKVNPHLLTNGAGDHREEVTERSLMQRRA